MHQQNPANHADHAGGQKHNTQTCYNIAPHGRTDHANAAHNRCNAVNQRGGRAGIAALLVQHNVGTEGTGNGAS